MGLLLMTWTIVRIKKELQKISDKYDDTFSIEVGINGRLTRTLGRVEHKRVSEDIFPVKLEISKQLLETSTDDDIIGVIKHEWAHYYITKITKKNHNHDSSFKALCAEIGTHGTTSIRVERTVEIESKYELICPNCGKVVARYTRKCKTTEASKVGLVTSKCCNAKVTLKQNW